MVNIQTPYILQKRTVPKSVILEDVARIMVFAAKLSTDMSKRPRDEDDLSSRLSKLSGDMARTIVDMGEVLQRTDESRERVSKILAKLHSYEEMFRIKV
jgi:hypothetical protein